MCILETGKLFPKPPLPALKVWLGEVKCWIGAGEVGTRRKAASSGDSGVSDAAILGERV